MIRQTIDFGIDLGTTNSTIAVFEKHGPRVLRNNEGMEYTPSAVWIDKRGAIRVGSAAKDRLVNDAENSITEFKLWMGTTQTKTFLRTHTTLTPEELSAEVLKSLRQDAKRDTGEEIDSAVITVPAAFDQPGSEATRRAAQLAGIHNSEFLQEPIAAGLAYGFQTERDNVFWLVYDIGGGTFDAAVIHVRDGLMQVVHHGGDDHLGGKLIDWAIVEQLLVPNLLGKYRLPDFHRRDKNGRWLGAFAKLKLHAEKAKIALSKDESFDIDELICAAEDGEAVQLECTVTRTQLQALAHPIFAKSINICRRVLAEKNLRPGNIERVLLVGGPTYTPYLRQLLADRQEGLGIALESRVDPLTVVAQGAAIFAASRRRPRAKPTVERGRYDIDLKHYHPTGPDTEPLVAGQVLTGDRKPFSGFTIKFTNSDSQPPWNSGNIPLEESGIFRAKLWAEKQHQNVFTIELFDPAGRKCLVSPDSIHYTVGLVITDPPTPHNIGVAMANNEVDIFFEKGTPMPAKNKSIHRTVVALKHGSPDGRIRIPFVEGDHLQADLNRKIGSFEIGADQVSRDVPFGSEVEIKLELDSSRLLRGSIYVPILDMDVSLTMEGLVKPQPDISELKLEFQNQKQKLQELQEVVLSTNNSTLAEGLKELKREEAIGSIESLLSSADDNEAAQTCENRLLDLKATLRKLEAQIQFPKLLAEAKDEMEWARQAIEAHGTSEEQKRFEQLKEETETAMHGDEVTLQKKIANLFQFRIGILMRTPEYWLGYRDYLLEHQGEMSDKAQAQLWFSHADRAINNGDVEALKSACTQLHGLLPMGDQQRGYGGTTMGSSGLR